MKHKKVLIYGAYTLFFGLSLCTCLGLIILNSFNKDESRQKKYGVFIGADESQLDQMKGYEILVLDGQEFTKEEIKSLKAEGTTVYSYLNLGSIEQFRAYYQRFVDITIGEYSNWPDERWIDVSQRYWQDFLVEELAKELVNKGIDGFFIDNTDVYDIDPRAETYEGIERIFTRLKEEYQKEILVNGGNTFVVKLLQENKDKGFSIDGVNQETVFSGIDFSQRRLIKNEEEETLYYQNYLKTAKKAGLKVYLLEYVDQDKELVEEIQQYCKEMGYDYYIANSIELN